MDPNGWAMGTTSIGIDEFLPLPFWEVDEARASID